MYVEIAKARVYPAAVVMTSLLGSLFSPVYAADPPHVQEFVVTAYYSPLPNQCCYFRGNYEDEISFNGNGTNGADGTPVYAGMIAAPETYEYGTRIDLPGLGVGAVHDRGGRIVEWGNDLHRIDLWMGTGEQGLARALAWGARRVTGTVYPIGSEAMPSEHFSVDSIPSDTTLLASLPKIDTSELLLQAEFGNKEYSVRVLQSVLKDLGYFKVEVNAQYGEATQQALKDFLSSEGLVGDGAKVDVSAAAALSIATSIKPENLPDIVEGLDRGVTGNDVRQLQKLLRFLGFYRGRTDGLFDAHLRESVVAFQMKHGIVAHALDTYAGRIGPATKAAILRAWKTKIIAMKFPVVAAKMHLVARVKEEGLSSKVLSLRDHGKEVSALQAFLHTTGYLSAKDVTGTFGSHTQAALLKYQLETKIIASAMAHGAGIFGPATKTAAMKEMVAVQWRELRANGVGEM